MVFTSTRLASTTWWYSWCRLRLSLNSDVQELPAEEKEDYVSRAILLMHNQPMVSIVVVIHVLFLQLLIPRRRRRESAAPRSEPFTASTTFPC